MANKQYSLGTTKLRISNDSFVEEKDKTLIKAFNKKNNSVEYEFIGKKLKNGVFKVPFSSNKVMYICNQPPIYSNNSVYPFETFERLDIKNESNKVITFEFKYRKYETGKNIVENVTLYENETFVCKNARDGYILDAAGVPSDSKGNEISEERKDFFYKEMKLLKNKIESGTSNLDEINKFFIIVRAKCYVREAIETIFSKEFLSHQMAERFDSYNAIYESKEGLKRILNGNLYFSTIISNFISDFFIRINANYSTITYFIEKIKKVIIDEKDEKYSFLFCSTILPAILIKLNSYENFNEIKSEQSDLLNDLLDITIEAVSIVKKKESFQLYDLPEDYNEKIAIHFVKAFLSNGLDGKFHIYNEKNFDGKLREFLEKVQLIYKFNQIDLCKINTLFLEFQEEFVYSNFFDYFFCESRLETTKKEFLDYLQSDLFSEDEKKICYPHISKLIFSLDKTNYRTERIRKYVNENEFLRKYIISWIKELKDVSNMKLKIAYALAAIANEKDFEYFFSESFDNQLLKLSIFFVCNNLIFTEKNDFENLDVTIEKLYSTSGEYKEDTFYRILEYLCEMRGYFYKLDGNSQIFINCIENGAFFDDLISHLNQKEYGCSSKTYYVEYLNKVTETYLNRKKLLGGDKYEMIKKAYQNRIINTLRYNKKKIYVDYFAKSCLFHQIKYSVDDMEFIKEIIKLTNKKNAPIYIKNLYLLVDRIYRTETNK